MPLCDQPIAGVSLWRNRDFTLLWSAQTLSLAGLQITSLALPLTAILALDASPLQVGLLTAVQYLPFLAVGLPAGVWVDRHRRRPILIAADVSRAVILLAVPAASSLGMLHLAVLYPIAFLIGSLTVLFDVTHLSYVPSLVRGDKLMEANARLQVSSAGAELAGPGLSGVLIQLLTAPLALLANAAAYAGSATLLLFVRAVEDQPTADVTASLWREIAAGVRYVVGHDLLRPIAITTSVGNLFGMSGMVRAVLALFAVRVLHLSPAAFGLALAIAGAGTVIGAVVSDRLIQALRVGRTLTLAVFGIGAGVVLSSFATPGSAVAMLAGSLFLTGFADSVYNVNQVSLRQTITPPSMLGRMNATVRFLVWGTIPVGALMGGAVASAVGLRQALLLAGVGSVLAGLPILLSRVRRLPSPGPPASPRGVRTGPAS